MGPCVCKSVCGDSSVCLFEAVCARNLVCVCLSEFVCIEFGCVCAVALQFRVHAGYVECCCVVGNVR